MGGRLTGPRSRKKGSAGDKDNNEEAGSKASSVASSGSNSLGYGASTKSCSSRSQEKD